MQNSIPQGSAISVLLFIIAGNNTFKDIQSVIDKSLYVDDSAIFYLADSITEAESVLQPAVDKILTQAESLGFKFSTAKFHGVHFL